MTAIISYINALDIFSLFLIGLLILTKGADTPVKWPSLFFIYCVITYLSMDFIPSGMIRTALISGPMLVPFSFLVLANRLFSDRAYGIGAILPVGLTVLIVYYTLLFLGRSDSCNCANITALLGRSISLLFVLLAIYEAQKLRNTDLVEARRKVRTLFTYFISVVVLLTLLSELGLSAAEQRGLPRLVQRSAILLFLIYFLITNVSMKDTFLGSAKKGTASKNPELADRITEFVNREKLYRQEALTIGQLGGLINEQEYKVRQAINQDLGYRNFTDFINSFRIMEAKSFFSDLANREMTVLEIAYKVGFNSIGPFNRAFKSATGQTPTEFRKSI